jgi:hypothetical protein
VGREGLPPIVDVKDLNAVRQRLAQTFAASADEQAGDLGLTDAPSTEAPGQLAGDGEPAIPLEGSAIVAPYDSQPTVQKPAVQKPDAHRTRFTAERQVAQFLHEAGLAQKVMDGESFDFKIENEPYLPLVIEAHDIGGDRRLYLTHYREQNGDLIHDGEMVFAIKASGHLQLHEVAVQNALTGGEMRDYDREFADIFSRNILEQGFAAEALKQVSGQTVLNCAPQEMDETFEGKQSPQTTVLRTFVEKGEKAASYLEDLELAQAIKMALTTQSRDSENITIKNSLIAQVKTTIELARNKQQAEFASELLPIAQRLFRTANRAGLTRSRWTEQGQVTAFEGKNYSVRCRTSDGQEEFKLLCHHTNGLVYAVNGSLQKSQGLSKADSVRLAKYANMAPAQLMQVIRAQQATAGLTLST